MIDKWEELNSSYWNANCYVRASDIESGNDITYNSVVVPYVDKFVKMYADSNDRILDIGSGCGFLTNIISKTNNVVGIDIADELVNYSRQLYPHISFQHKSIYSYLNSNENFNICIATLVVHTLSSISDFFKVVRSLLLNNGYLMFIIPHPCFWIEKKISGFNKYRDNNIYILPFNINSNNNYPAKMIYFHRTLSDYFNTAVNSEFEVLRIDELYESDSNLKKGYKSDLIAFILKKKMAGLPRFEPQSHIEDHFLL